MTTTASAGIPVDQRTGQPTGTGSIPTAAQLNEQRKAWEERERVDRDELVGYLEQTLASQVTSGEGTVNVRRLNVLIEAELTRLSLVPDGIAGALAAYRLAAKTPTPKARDIKRDMRFRAATDEAETLMAELDNRSAWLYRNFIAQRAMERRVSEVLKRLTALQTEHRLPIDLGRYTRLAGEAIGLAGQYVVWINSHPDANLWRQTLPELEVIELPAELLATGAVPSQATDQLNRKAFDPDLPKDYALRAAAASRPAARNSDGTLVGGSVQSPFGGNSNGVTMPRSEAEDRAARKKVADELEGDGPDGKR